ncbi:MAG: class F sortase [Patescibacteria group bacterium]|nr:class F sortase [Patescibacteria group bacterium]
MKESARIGVVVLLTSIAAGVFTATAVHAVYYAPQAQAPEPALEAVAPALNVSSSERPAQLQIPKLNIDSSVLGVGLGVTGNMAVPPNFTDVGWYKYGPVPGQWGSAVIDGHVDNGLSLAGVFKRLNELSVGDDVYIVTTSGTRLHFVVTDVESYPYEAVPVGQVFDQADAKRLNLITCEGSWVEGGKTYDHRLVVYTTLVS